MNFKNHQKAMSKLKSHYAFYIIMLFTIYLKIGGIFPKNFNFFNFFGGIFPLTKITEGGNSNQYIFNGFSEG